MKTLCKAFIVSALSLLFLTNASAQLKLNKKAQAEFDRLNAENLQLRQRSDSLKAVIDIYLATIDSLSTEAPDPYEAEFELSDSLLHKWYLMHHSYNVAEFDIEGERFSSDVSDEVFVQRLSDMNSFIPIPFNETVKKYCILYSEKMPAKMSVIMGNCMYYWPIFDEILSHYDLPLELKALVIVESMMSPTATSRVGAKGLWQFMYGTARGYGMRIDSFMDERMDPVTSTLGAARYLKNAYSLFGDWYLAIASYNCGAGNVNKAIRRSGGKRAFWDIYDYLPRETRGYVPAFIGALYATHYYKEYNIVPTPSAIAVPVDTFHINRNLHFQQLEEVVGVPSNLVADLNPAYLHKIIPGDSNTCVLRLPMTYTNAFIDAGDSLYMHKRDSLLDPVHIKKIADGLVGNGNRIVYKVKSGDVLGKIANRYGVSVSQLKQWNGLKNNNIRIGQKLIIYTRKG